METQFSRVGGKIVTDVEFIDEHRYVPKAIGILNQVGNLRLTGETGTGKTYLTYALAQKLEMPLFEDVLTRDTSRWDLLGQDILESGSSTVRKGIVTQWLEAERAMLYMDGANYSEPSIFSLFESLADFRGNVFIPELNRVYKRTKDHLLVISFNPAEKIGYSGTYQMNIATMRRFEGFTMEYLSEDKETKLIKAICGNYNFARKWVEIANKTRVLYRKGQLHTPLTTGNLKNYAKLWKFEHMAEEDIIDIAKSLYPEEQHTTVVRLWESSKSAQQMFDATQQTTP